MYELQDVIDFNGGKLDTDTLTAKSNVTGVTRGVEDIHRNRWSNIFYERYRSD